MNIELFLLINIFFKLLSFKSPLDWDTSSHLYCAFLKEKKVNIFYSYQPGIKYILPYIYQVLPEKNWQFRIYNLLMSSLIIFLWNFQVENTNIYWNFMILLLGTLLINSLWVNYLTSASEFFSSFFLLVIMVLPDYLSFPYVYAVQLVILFVIIFSCKWIDFIYIIPVCMTYWESLATNWAVFLLLTLIFALSITPVVFKSIKNSLNYSKTRKIASEKNKIYIKRSIYFIVIIFSGTAYNLINPDLDAVIKLYIVFALLAFAVQKSYISYFYYPLIVINIYATLQADIKIPVWFGFTTLSVFLVIVIYHLRFVFTEAEFIDVNFRKYIMGQDSHASYLKNRETDIEWLKSHISTDKQVYLWGSHCYLLLAGHLQHIPETFYNHNHLLYWNNIENTELHILKLLRKKKPDYLIESGIINHFGVTNEIKKQYRLIHQGQTMRVYQFN